MFRRFAIVFAIAFLISISNQLTAQIPDKFENLKVIPKDIGKRELINIMRHFAGSLGVRCNYCHAGKDGKEASPNDLSTINFASDAVPAKGIARLMLKMKNTINDDHLTLVTEKSSIVKVNCLTCHKGMKKPPRNLDEIIIEEIDANGTDAGFNKYVELREKYYGANIYDFRFKPFYKMSESLINADKSDEVIKFMEKYLDKIDSKSWEAFLQIGLAYHEEKQFGEAKKHYEKALEISPENGRVTWYYNQLKKDIEKSKSGD